MTATSPSGPASGPGERIDPLNFEILRHRLWATADEVATTLIKTAGSPAVVSANDFIVALFTATGELALAGWGANRHVSCTALACRALREQFDASEIEEDDVFLLNDPYVAAIHQQDVYVISPLHFDGELIGWLVNFTHLQDVGGIDPGWCPRATDVRQEGLRIPGLKIVERGKLRRDVWHTLLNMTREPEMNALQLRAQMAANNTGKEKLQGLIRQIGLGRYRTLVAQMIEHSEQGLRARLRRLPDGTWRTREYFDTPDRIYRIELAMTKQGDQLHFDFTGTSEQAPSFVNCTHGGTRGGVFVSMSTLLAHDLTWNEGLLRPLSVTVPEGTLLNCKFPAPVSMGTIAASRLATTAAFSTLASMLATTDAFADDVSAQWTAGSADLAVSGVNGRGEYFVLAPFFGHAGGGGARRGADGVSTGGGISNPMFSSTNVETLERNAPVLFLFRREVPDSGGPGVYRGGLTAELAFVTGDVPSGRLNVSLHGSGLAPAMAYGRYGGLPGCNVRYELRRATPVRELLASGMPQDLAALGGELEPLPPQGLVEIDEEAVFLARVDGGGGLGDPLRRPPERVLADVAAGRVSPRQARDQYGVALAAAGDAVDVPATAHLREEVRRSRLGAAAPAALPPVEDVHGLTPAPVEYDEERGVTRCAACDRELGPVGENWKRHAVADEQPLAALGELMGASRFVLRGFACPGCGVLLDTEMTLPEDPPIHTYSPLVEGH
ncbi:MAG TPA: hydantoinase B/oxoprolinase family protein [Chloroflexota bacterium]|nr:hydantoinase B/oxoprolinase family protein [Chloroflexota bacterium]